MSKRHQVRGRRLDLGHSYMSSLDDVLQLLIQIDISKLTEVSLWFYVEASLRGDSRLMIQVDNCSATHGTLRRSAITSSNMARAFLR